MDPRVANLPPLPPDLAVEVLDYLFVARRQRDATPPTVNGRVRRLEALEDDLLSSEPASLRSRSSARDFDLITFALRYAHDEEWASRPRLYAICRQAGLLSLENVLMRLDIHDSALPFSQEIPPPTLAAEDLNRFLDFRYRTLEYEAVRPRSVDRQHRHFVEDHPVGIHRLQAIYGTEDDPVIVDHVYGWGDHQQYARKRLRRTGLRSRETIKVDQFHQEMAILKRISYQHLVQLAGSYTSRSFYALLMSPVAGSNLAELLQQRPYSSE